MGRLDNKTVQTLTGRRLAPVKGHNGLANLNVRFGSLANIPAANRHVRFTPKVDIPSAWKIFGPCLRIYHLPEGFLHVAEKMHDPPPSPRQSCVAKDPKPWDLRFYSTALPGA
jgi:hypothetical protein